MELACLLAACTTGRPTTGVARQAKRSTAFLFFAGCKQAGAFTRRVASKGCR
jgi:hypothetical protein